MIKWIEHLCIVGAFQVLFLIISFSLKKENRKANFILSAILVLLALDLISLYLKVGGRVLYLPLLSKFMLSSVYLYGSLIYLYTKIQTGLNQLTNTSIIFHILPPLLSILFFIFISPDKFSEATYMFFYVHLYTGYISIFQPYIILY